MTKPQLLIGAPPVECKYGHTLPKSGLCLRSTCTLTSCMPSQPPCLQAIPVQYPAHVGWEVAGPLQEPPDFVHTSLPAPAVHVVDVRSRSALSVYFIFNADLAPQPKPPQPGTNPPRPLLATYPSHTHSSAIGGARCVCARQSSGPCATCSWSGQGGWIPPIPPIFTMH